MSHRKEPSKQLGVRLPLLLVQRLERHFERVQDQRSGAPVSMREVLRDLLTRALDEAEGEGPSSGRQ